MDALILAAGEGTRLRPLTYTRPKPLLPILNRPLLERTLEYLSRFSIDRVILNTHHLANQFETYLPSLRIDRLHELATRYETLILNTGGGLVNTRDFLKSDPFVVISGDILTDIDLKKVLDFHQSHNDPATLVLHDYPEFNQIKVDSEGRILKFRTGDGQGLDFTNIHILDQVVFRFLPSSGSFDIIPAYQRMIDKGITIRAYVSQGHHWWNIGTPASYLKVHEELLTGRSSLENSIFKMKIDYKSPSIPLLQRGTNRPAFTNPFSPPFNKGGLGGVLIHPEAVIEPGVTFSGWACIGKGCLLKTGCRIHHCVLWEDVTVEEGVSISESIIGQGVQVVKDMDGKILIS